MANLYVTIIEFDSTKKPNKLTIKEPTCLKIKQSYKKIKSNLNLIINESNDYN